MKTSETNNQELIQTTIDKEETMTRKESSNEDLIVWHEQAVAQMKAAQKEAAVAMDEDNFEVAERRLYDLGFLMQAMADKLDICQECLHDLLEQSFHLRHALLERGTLSQVPPLQILEEMADEFVGGLSTGPTNGV